MEIQKAHKLTIETLVGCKLNDSEIWIPKTKMIGNTKVMLLSKWDRGLTRFMTGKSLDLRATKTKSLNNTAAGAYFDELCRQRKVACEKAVISAHSTDDGNGKQKRRRVTLSDSMSHLSPLVDISLPEVVEPAMPKRIVQVAFGTGPEIWLEVNETNLLQVIRGCCECTMSKGRTRKKVKAEPSPAADSADAVLDSPREPGSIACEESQSYEVKCEVESLQQEEVESHEGNTWGEDAYDATLVDDQHLDTQPYGEHLEILKRQNAKVWNERQ